MGNDNTHPAPSERLEAYYTERRTSEIDTKGKEICFHCRVCLPVS